LIRPKGPEARTSGPFARHRGPPSQSIVTFVEDFVAPSSAKGPRFKANVTFVEIEGPFFEVTATSCDIEGTSCDAEATPVKEEGTFVDHGGTIGLSKGPFGRQEGTNVSHEGTFIQTGGPTMTTTSTSTHRTIASLKLPNKMPALVTYAQGIVKSMTGNASFPNPVPTLATVSAAIEDFQTAETAALARTKGAVATRNEKRSALAQLLEQLKGYVQTAADGNVDNGESIILSAGIAVRKTAIRAPRIFAAKPGAVSGAVTLVAASAAHRASYEWQYSADGGKTWVAAPTTLQAKTSVSGLTPGVTMAFKYRAVTKAGEGDWSQPTSLMVK
jgi:hypothetical protein